MRSLALWGLGAERTYGIDIRVALHLSDEDGELVRGCDAGTVAGLVLGLAIARGHVRCAKHEHCGDSDALFARHLELGDGIEREEEQNDVEGHAGAIERHLCVVVVPVIHVHWPLERVEELVKVLPMVRDENREDGVDNDEDGL